MHHSFCHKSDFSKTTKFWSKTIIVAAISAMMMISACDDSDGKKDPNNDPCTDINCSGHGTCAADASNAPKCTCDSGYHNPEGNLLVCEANDSDDPCKTVNCSGHGTCSVNTDNQPVCACNDGFIPGAPGQCIEADANHNYMLDNEETDAEQGKDCLQNHHADCAGGFCDSFLDYKCSTKCTTDTQCINDDYFCRHDGRCAPRVFETVWEIASENNELLFPCGNEQSTNYSIDWGDGNSETFEKCDAEINRHTYSAPGEYHVKVTGKIVGWKCGVDRCGYSEEDPNALIAVVSFGPVVLDNNQAFAFANELNAISSVDIPDLSQTQSLHNLFLDSPLINQPMQNWDVSAITNLESVFDGATAFNQPLQKWDTSNVTTMKSMFCRTADFNQPLNAWDTSKVTDMDSMFSYAVAFNQPLNQWNTANVTTMASMFYHAESFNSSLEGWITTKVTTMDYMFEGAAEFNQSINEWNVSNTTNMISMFCEATKYNQPMDKWDVSSLIVAENMFEGATSFNQPLNAWNTPRLRHIEYMFNRAAAFNQPLDHWTVSVIVPEHYMDTFKDSGLTKETWDIMKQNEGWANMSLADLGLPANFKD